MKTRNIILMAVCAAVAITIALLVQPLVSPRQVYAQTTTSNPIQMTVTSAPVAGTAAYAPSTSGIISINDPNSRTVVVVSYNFSYGVATPGTGPQGTALALSTAQSFHY
jgi:hypothetical protein